MDLMLPVYYYEVIITITARILLLYSINKLYLFILSADSSKIAKFNSDWLNTHKWLTYDEKSSKMSCRICRATGKKNAMANGTSNFRTSTLTRHIALPEHQQAVDDERRQVTFRKTVQNAFSKRTDSLEKGVAVAYYLGKENIPPHKFGSMLNLVKFLGVDVGSMEVGKNATYTSKQTVSEFQECAAELIRDDLVKKAKRSPFISLLTDETTDITNTKKMIIYIRLINPDNLQASTHFLGDLSVKGIVCSGESLFNHLVEFLNTLKVFDTDTGCPALIGFGSDGASVMTGKRQGVATRFKEKYPHLISIHCMAHRFNLVTSQASKDIPFIKDDFEKTFKDLYYFFNKSANRTAELKEIQKVLDSEQLKIKQVFEIRWLAFFDALQAVFKSWQALVKYFQKKLGEEKGKKEGSVSENEKLLSKLTDYRFVSLLHMMADVIPKLSQVNLLFQKTDLDLTVISTALDNLKSSLKKSKNGDSFYMRDFKQQLTVSPNGKTATFKGVQLKIHRSKVAKATDDILSMQNEFISALQQKLEERFPRENSSVVSAFEALSLKKAPLLDGEELEQYGNNQLEVLIQHFGLEKTSQSAVSPPFIDQDLVRQEWALAKQLVKREQYQTTSTTALWQILQQQHAGSFPNLLKLVSIQFVLPLNTADCERGFSRQNLIKNALRNRTGEKSLNTQMLISLEGPDVDSFNYSKCVAVWKTKKDREDTLGGGVNASGGRDSASFASERHCAKIARRP